MKTFLKNFIADESGASAAEYALIIAIVGVGVGAAALALGNNVTAAIGGAADDVHNCNVETQAGDSKLFNAADDCTSFAPTT
ncbi:MAG: Flp family type IVb pilin [Pseudorhizobium sp.]